MHRMSHKLRKRLKTISIYMKMKDFFYNLSALQWWIQTVSPVSIETPFCSLPAISRSLMVRLYE